MGTKTNRVLAASLLWAALGAHAMDNNQTLDGQCGLKTGGGWEGAGFWANVAYGVCTALGGDYALGAAQELGKFYDDQYGEVTFYKSPQNNKEYYVQKKSGQFRLGLGAQFQVVPPPPGGKIFLPKVLPNPQPGPVLSLSQFQQKQQAAQGGGSNNAGGNKPKPPGQPPKKKCPPGKPNVGDCDLV